MLIRHLSFFVTLAQEKHFARAAEVCNVAQPTLSAAIRKLEDDLNTTLILRSRKYIALTPEGEKALIWGRQILTDFDSLRKDLTAARKGLTGVLRLGVIPAAMPSVSFLKDAFREHHPSAAVEINSMTSRAIQHSLDAFEIDCGLTYLDNEPLEHVLKLPLYRERYVFVCRPDHPFAERAVITLADAVTQPLCLLSEDMPDCRILKGIATAAASRSIRPLLAIRFLWSARICAVETGAASCLIPFSMS